MYRYDWILHQIQMLVRFIARLIWNKDTIEYQIAEHNNLSETDLLYFEIEELLAHYKICEAENLLHERLDKNNNKYLELAIDFYLKLNNMSDEALENADFSREEIESGLKEVTRIFGLPYFNLQET